MHEVLRARKDERLLLIAELPGLLDGAAQRALRLADILQELRQKVIELFSGHLLERVAQARDEQDDLLVLLVGVVLLLTQHPRHALPDRLQTG